jgi:NADH-quinone oxidoreductase subunit F
MNHNSVCFRTLHHPEPAAFSTYCNVGGYAVLEKILTAQPPRSELLNIIKQSALRGRGGAGFPTGLKLGFIAADQEGQKYLVCNADEGEPGTCKDRDVLRYNPHQLLEGMIIAGYMMGATVGYVYFRGEFYEPLAIFEQALKEAEHFLNAAHFTCYTHMGAGAYICGEETALLESLEGKPGKPRFKPPFPAQHGLYGRPTTVCNVETLASIPVILEKGATWFLEQGKPNNGGLKLFSITGHVVRPCNVEVPLGIPFPDMLKLAGGLQPGRTLQAVIPGGSSAPVLPASIMETMTMDYDALSKAGSMLGSGAVIIIDDTANMVDVLYCIVHFYKEESCGQCTPCREGTGWLLRLLHRVCTGHATPDTLRQLHDVAERMIGRTICAFGDAVALPVQSFLRHFPDAFHQKIAHL